jgi:hypothetical protein
MTPTEEIEKMSDMAVFNRQKTIEVKQDMERNFLDLAMLLCQSRDFALWKLLGHDSMESYLGEPEIGIRRSTAFNLMRSFDLYITKLAVAQDDLVEAGSSKLTMLAPYIEKHPEKVLEWVDKAKALSKSDLREELLQVAAAGSKTLPPSQKKSPTLSPPLDLKPRMTPEQYIELVKSSPCINCGAVEGVVPAHFPRTRVRAEKPWHVIPLCGKCHGEQEGCSSWMWTYRANWCRWFYGLIVGEDGQTKDS